MLPANFAHIKPNENEKFMLKQEIDALPKPNLPMSKLYGKDDDIKFEKGLTKIITSNHKPP